MANVVKTVPPGLNKKYIYIYICHIYIYFAIKPLRHCVFGVREIRQRFHIVTSSTQHKHSYFIEARCAHVSIFLWNVRNINFKILNYYCRFLILG